MKPVSLYRRRLIPAECISLHEDTILFYDNVLLVTSWKTIRPKKNMDHGFSCYYLNEGYKISRFYRADGTLLYIYCDIIEPVYEDDGQKLVVTDLLADVIIDPDGFVKVADLDELVTASENGSLSDDLLKKALLRLHKLLEQIYAGKLSKLLSPIDPFDTGTSKTATNSHF